MFYEFPEDEKCWDLRDQYMFGSDYLVAPVLKADMKEREVYLPKGKWQDIRDGKTYSGGQTVKVPTPIDSIPVFKRGEPTIWSVLYTRLNLGHTNLLYLACKTCRSLCSAFLRRA